MATDKLAGFGRFLWVGVETGPACVRCNVLMVLRGFVEGRREWQCPRCWERR